MPPTNGWDTWGKHVLKELENCSADIKELNEKMTRLQVDIAKLKTEVQLRSGFTAAVISVAITVLLLLLKSKLI